MKDPITRAVTAINAVMEDRDKYQHEIAMIQLRRFADSKDWTPRIGLDDIALYSACHYSISFADGHDTICLDLATLPANHALARRGLIRRFVPQHLQDGVKSYFKEVGVDV